MINNVKYPSYEALIERIESLEMELLNYKALIKKFK